MANRFRKKKYHRPKQFIPVEDFLVEQKEIYFAEVVKLFNLDKYKCIPWNISSPSFFINGLNGQEVLVQFLHNIDSYLVGDSETGESPYFIIGQLELSGNMAGIIEFLNSGYVTQTTLRLLTNGDYSLCIWVALPTSNAAANGGSDNNIIVLTSPVSINLDMNQEIFANLCSNANSHTIQLFTMSKNDQCLVIYFLASRKLFNLDGANSLLGNKTRSLNTSIVRMFHESIVPPDMLCLHDDVMIDPVFLDSYEGPMTKIFQMYKWVRSHQASILPIFPPLPSVIPGLTATLHPYQIQAVQWMLYREQTEGWFTSENRDQLHPIWQEIIMEGRPPLYYNCYTGRFSLERYSPPMPIKGGILGDEMGLGKTVEVLVLILTHKWEEPTEENTTMVASQEDSMEIDNDSTTGDGKENSVNSDNSDVWCLCGVCTKDGGMIQCDSCCVWQHSKCVDYDITRDKLFVCVRCLTKSPISCGATLIIAPESLLPQWLEEIAKHTDIKTLRVMEYWGVSRQYINPLHIAKHDIVMVTYETLRKELARVHHHEFSLVLRKRKVSHYPPSPLLAIKWWRICLDEAQTVESINAKAAEMTHKLAAVNRWCVTGTPVQRDLSDLFGLVYFLKYQPYSLQPWWIKLIWKPYRYGIPRPMIALFSNLMWRNSKADVADQLCLPAMKEEIHMLKFSSIEEYFYKKQKEQCTTNFHNAISGWSNCSDYLISDLHRSLVTKLLNPLYTLRQACCHPQLIKKGYITMSQNKKNSYLSMSDLLVKLVSQAKQEGREDLRQLVAALNGQAAIYIIEKEYEKAIRSYREAIEVWNNHKDKFVCDRLQRIHTMENLAYLFEKGYTPFTRKLSDDHLRQEASVLRAEYMKSQENQVIASVQLLSMAAFTVTNTLEKAYNSQHLFLCSTEDIPQDSQVNVISTIDEIENGNKQGEESMEQEERGKEQEVNGEEQEDNEEEQKDNGEEQEDSEEEQEDTEDEQEDNEEEQKDKEEEQEDNGEEQEDNGEEQEERGEEQEDEDMREEEPCTQLMDDIEHFTKQDTVSIKAPNELWWFSVIAWTRHNTRDGELLSLLETEKFSSNDYIQELSFFNFKDLSGLELAVLNHFDKIKMQRDEVLRLVGTLSEMGPPSNELVQNAAQCHLKTNRVNPTHPCVYCKTERDIKTYEELLFSRFSIRNEDTHNNQSRTMSICEKLLRSSLSFIKTKRAPNQLCTAGTLLVKYFEVLRKEFKHIHNLWIKTEERVRACDELSMAATRLTLADNHHSNNQELLMESFLLSEYELKPKLLEFSSDIKMARIKLQKSHNQIVYLQNLSTEHDLTCPICISKLIQQWSVLPCGHSICYECVNTLIKRHTAPSVHHIHPNERRVFLNCPVCRDNICSSNIQFVRGDNVDSDNDDTIQLNGSYSTKIKAIVCMLMTIQLREPGAKSLVFSASYEVLNLINFALRENDIDHIYVCKKSTFQKNLQLFKTSPTHNVLLMPMSSGSKGLNITEATHVLLVEPSLNIGAELQAIGRIHRLGQTKETTVHRFYIYNSIEESIRTMMNTSSTKDISQVITASAIGEQDSNLTIGELQSLLQ